MSSQLTRYFPISPAPRFFEGTFESVSLVTILRRSTIGFAHTGKRNSIAVDSNQFFSEQMTARWEIGPLRRWGFLVLLGGRCSSRKPIQGNGEEILFPFAALSRRRSQINPGSTPYQILCQFCWVLTAHRLRTWYIGASGHKPLNEPGMVLHSLQISAVTEAPGHSLRVESQRYSTLGVQQTQ
jgi:hypothetical protein